MIELLYEKDLHPLATAASSAGVMLKWYDRVQHTFIKTSSVINGDHIEAIMECIASEIARLMGVRVLHYHLDILQLNDGQQKRVCVSADYRVSLQTSESISAQLFLISKEVDWTRRQPRYGALIHSFPHIRNDLDKMIAFDYLIDNYDRHMRNIELFRDCEGNVHLAPLFDNGSSLLADLLTEDDLFDLRSDETLYEEHMVLGQTPSKCFAHEHSTELLLIDHSVLSELHLDWSSNDIHNVTEQYSEYLSPLRRALIREMIDARLQTLRRLRG